MIPKHVPNKLEPVYVLPTKPYNILITGMKGCGKSTAGTKILEAEHARGSICIYPHDAKNLYELAAISLNPNRITGYNKDRLDFYGLEPTSIEIEIIEPLNDKLPNSPFFNSKYRSMSLWDLDEDIINLIMGSVERDGSSQLIMTARSNLKKNDDKYDLFNAIDIAIDRDIIKLPKGEIIKLPSLANLGFRGANQGDATNVRSILNNVSFTREDNFLMPEGCEWNINIKKDFLQRPDIVKIMSNKRLNREKSKYIYITNFFKKLTRAVENNEHKAKRIFILLDELQILCTSESDKNLSRIFTDILEKFLNTTARNNNISICCISQSMAALNQNLLDKTCFDMYLIGRIKSKVDDRHYKEVWKWDDDLCQKVQELQNNYFLATGFKDYDAEQHGFFYVYPPTCPIKEPDMNIEVCYAHDHPEKCINPHEEILPQIMAIINGQEKRFEERVEKEIAEAKAKMSEIKEEKEKKAKAKETKETTKEDQILIYLKEVDGEGNPKYSNKQIAVKVKTSEKTIQRRRNRYKALGTI